jgi:hypothetical protein
MARRTAAVAALALTALGACADPASPDLTNVALSPSNLRIAAAKDGSSGDASAARSAEVEAKHLDRGRFNITLKYVTPVTDAQRAVFEAAAARWERIIIKDVPSVTGTLPSAFRGAPPVSTTVVDDVIIEVALQLIDGPGVNGRNVLGQAGPRFIRFVDGLPVSGVMFFDTFDLDFLAQRGLFDEVIEHEMGHVLGIGTLWNLGAPFPITRALRQGPVADYAFVGKFANIHWNAEGGEGLLPIANVGAAGSIGSHWRESALRNELMTPSINSGVDNPLSRITAASLRDLGYGVGIVGEQYDLLRGTMGAADPNAEAAAQAATKAAGGLDIAEGEDLLEPVGVVMPQ